MALNENPTLEEIVNEIERLNSLILDRGGERIITPTTTNQILAKGNYKGDITVLGDANLVSSNILSGKSIFGVQGNVVKGKKWAKGSFVQKIRNTNKSITIPLNLSFYPSSVILRFSTGFDSGYATANYFYANSSYNDSYSRRLSLISYGTSLDNAYVYFKNVSSSSAELYVYTGGSGGFDTVEWVAYE